jgi:hypothetical protein
MPDEYQDLSTSDNIVQPVPDSEREGDRTIDLLTLANSPKDGKKRCVERMVREWNATEDRIRNLRAQWMVNKAQQKGISGAYLQKEKDTHTAYIPFGAHRSYTGMNKAARLCRRLSATLFADPPLPDVAPESNSEEDRVKAELTMRILSILGKKRHMNDAGTAKMAFELGSVYGSGMRYYYVDEKGGGHKPLQIQATPGTPDYRSAMEDPGEHPVLHYVESETEALSLEKPEDPVRVWLPRVRTKLITGKHLRFIPETCRDISDASGIMIGQLIPWGEVKSTYPEVLELSEEEQQQLCTERPIRSDELMPVGHRDSEGEEIKDNAFVFVLTRVHTQSAEYPFGAFLVSLGESFLPVAEEWYDRENDLPLTIPVDQFPHFHEEDNPYFQATMEILGPGNEVRAEILGTMLEFLDRFRNLKTFVPMTSNYQAMMQQFPLATHIPIAPGGEPKTEEIPNFPAAMNDMLQFVTDDLDDDSGLQTPSQGKESPQIESAKQTYALIEQAMMGLSDLQSNIGLGMNRGWQIQIELYRAFYTQPQKISWIGEDGAWKERSWAGKDLSGGDITVKRGSNTLFTPTMKTQLVAEWMNMGWVTHQEGKALVAGKMAEATGLEDDIHRNRIRQTLNVWLKGPPEGWVPPPPEQDPETGQEIPGLDPFLVKLFVALPVDLDPDVAAIRAYEMGKCMASAKAQAFPPEWQLALHQSYTVMRKAAGIQTIQEQQEAAQAEAQAQAQAEQQQQQAAQTQQETKLQEAQIQSQAEIQKAGMAAGRPAA